MGQSLAIPRVIPNDWKRLDLIINKIKFKLGSASSPTLTGLTLTGLTASRLVWTDSSKALASKDLIDLVAGTDDEINIADDGSGGVVVGIINPLIVGKGGTGAASLTDHGILLGSGTDAITPLGVASNGQLPIGSTGADPVLANLSGTTDHISVANGAGSITLDFDTNTKTLLGSFNGIFLEKLDFTISVADSTVTGSLEKDSTGDLIQRFSDGYTTLDCTPPLEIDLTAYVGSDAVPKQVFVYILQSNKTTIAASNSDWPATEHIKIANLLLKSAATTGNDGGALVNRNWNDFAFGSDSQGHITHVENRIRQEPSQWNSGVALTLKNSGGSELTTGNSSTAVEIVTSVGTVYQLHKHTFPAFDMYTTATDDAHVVNQPTDRGGAYETTADLVSDITHYVDGTSSGVAIGTNKYFNLVLWGVQNRSGEVSHIMINLPTGRYTTEANAIADVDGTSVFNIPALFKGMGFLIARLTFRLLVGPTQWTYIAQEDLRGQIPPISAGVSVTTTDHALLANVTSDQHHTESHTIVSHNDTSGTGAELNELTDGSETTLHSHAGDAAGGGTVSIFSFYYDSITQGTWPVVTDTTYRFNFYLYNSTHDDQDEIHFSTYLGAGTYTLKILMQTSPNAGIVDIYIDAAEVASFDAYSGGGVKDVLFTQTNIVVGSSGVKDIKYIIDGKNGSSSDHYTVFQEIVFYRTA